MTGGLLALEPVGGIAGDMLLGALLQLGAPRSALDEGLRSLAEAAGNDATDLRSVEVVSREAHISGILAFAVDVRVPEAAHARQPHHRPYRAIRDLLRRARLPERARSLALSAFERLAEAEGRVHGIGPDEVEFHEVGALDSIVDLVGSALLVAALSPARFVCLPPPSGSGVAQGAHGPMPIPAPATVELLRGRTLRPSGAGERTTPTGAAIVAAWTEEVAALPEMTVQAIGYGAGQRRFEDAPNVLRAILGAPLRASAGEAVWVLEANLDDLSPQLLAAALEAALSAGALDAWIAPVTMKKGRPGHLFGALASEAARAQVEEAIFRETSTLGVRAHRVERAMLERALVEVQTRYGTIRVKVGSKAGAAMNAAPEFDDCRRAAREHGVGVKEVMAAALAAYRALG